MTMRASFVGSVHAVDPLRARFHCIARKYPPDGDVAHNKRVDESIFQG